MLSPEEESGIKILVMLRTGELKGFACSLCNPALQKLRNCNGEDSDKPVWFHPEIGQYFICPIKTIPDTVMKWVDQYDYYTKFPTAYNVRYEDCNPKWWECVKLYDNLINEYQAKEHERAMANIKKKS